MKVFIDNSLLQKIASKEIHLEAKEILFGWPSLLEYLGISSLLDILPKFEETELYKTFMATLNSESPQETFVQLYEQLFAENLTQVKALNEIQPAYLLECIKNKPNEAFSLPLAYYEKILREEPDSALHDLTLYIAWDRVCVDAAIIFEQSSSNSKIRNGLEVIKECLVDSFQHIMEEGKTVPSFFRLIEAFYAYDMREDNLQMHADSEWLILCQGSRSLKSRDVLPDAFYIDAAVALEHDKHTLNIWTLDSPDKVKSGQALAEDMIRKIKINYPKWRYTLSTATIKYLK